ncbi:hypothetical protein GCM10027176_78600 [Actinoallomurus bryophytorum]|uniref:Excreted virulence factor EspC (Type VII ESX diderm) n=1 Tax=Actinoallomurus bryophytorum TaxID=1490222 RepID=A0A543CFX4_9ACTN|nr:DUF6317 family protein [Actinoallomurus bryophytorum]TQL95900.1 hypothetical protein FB559_1412 [Actinoallomurus bryophytorum]
MSGYDVIFDDLVKASAEFSKQGEAYANLMPHKPACPAGGDDAIDKMLNVTLQALYEMHTVLAQSISAHAYKLDYAHRHYSKVERDVFDHIVEAPRPEY